MRIVRLFLSAFTLLWPAVVLAQAAPPPPPKHEETLEASFVGVNGNASSNTFGLGADVIARPGTWVFRHKVSFVRNEADEVLTAKAFDYIGRAQKALTPRAALFGEYEFFRDRFAGIRRRNTVTGGVTLKAVNSARQTLAFDAGAGFISERKLTGVDVSSASYLVGTGYALKISETANLTDDFKLTGIVDDSSDYRVTHGVSITTRLAAGLSLKVSNLLRYAHQPPPGFKTLDSITSVAVVAKFAH